MNNNDILRSLRFSSDISDVNMAEIFKLGGLELTPEEVKNILKKDIDEGYVTLKNEELNKWLNGFIIFKRGVKEPKEGEKPVPEEMMHPKKNSNNNNIILKKLRIAFNLKSDNMLELFRLGGVELSESELSALFRKRDHKNYMECGDKFIRVFLKGLVEKYRNNMTPEKLSAKPKVGKPNYPKPNRDK
jgi:uncharacterized protein YehS (DUF1456 family)